MRGKRFWLCSNASGRRLCQIGTTFVRETTPRLCAAAPTPPTFSPVQQEEDVREACPRPVHVLLQHLEEAPGLAVHAVFVLAGTGLQPRQGEPTATHGSWIKLLKQFGSNSRKSTLERSSSVFACFLEASMWVSLVERKIACSSRGAQRRLGRTTKGDTGRLVLLVPCFVDTAFKRKEVPSPRVSRRGKMKFESTMISNGKIRGRRSRVRTKQRDKLTSSRPCPGRS